MARLSGWILIMSWRTHNGFPVLQSQPSFPTQMVALTPVRSWKNSKTKVNLTKLRLQLLRLLRGKLEMFQVLPVMRWGLQGYPLRRPSPEF
ncbi:hypothetical protein I310_02970 [Cryptococcus deuterogattii CA1014]|nr:hypothetical protein I352_04154 [Cryptococcus deuterogattii MMRL2647]KIR73305.1 hypothetical protein I310_02970 [Cryptococcus deuterogattii CA1014]KIR99061.1 hypothetical protein L804_03682 [Cryptococcus deuterogattii 2001/935-1]